MSENAKHTPGPWEWAHCEDGDYAFLKGDGAYVLSPENVPGAAAWVDVNDANARLIAAAPDLLEALRRCRTHIAGYHLRYGGSEEASELVAEFFNELQRIHKVAGDAIAKAEGK